MEGIWWDTIRAEARVFKAGDKFDGRWTVGKVLGIGTFGAVYAVNDDQTGQLYAMKIELTTGRTAALPQETNILKELCAKGKKHVCQYIASNVVGNIRYLIMSLAGSNLADLKRATPQGRFSLNTVVRLGVQCLEAIREIHEIGFVHRDLKPANFATGLPGSNQRTLYILDFGLARRYRTEDGKLIRPRRNVGFLGTLRYASVNAHHGKELAPRDDLWNTFYMLVELRLCRLPWQHMEDIKEVGNIKESIEARELLHDLPAQFYLIYHALVFLKYDEVPDYAWYVGKLKKVMDDRGYKEDAPYDWEPGGEHYQHTLRTPVPEYPYASQIAGISELILSDTSSRYDD